MRVTNFQNWFWNVSSGQEEKGGRNRRKTINGLDIWKGWDITELEKKNYTGVECEGQDNKGKPQGTVDG